MIAFLIFYFVFSALFTIGVQMHHSDSVSFSGCVICVFLGWLLMPIEVGMLFAGIYDGDLEVNINKDE